MRRRFVVLCIIVSGICAAVVSFAQSKPQPRFEVAVDKPASRGSSNVIGEPAGGVSVFKERERLGLKLEQRRIPVEVIVVDRISRTPTAN